MNITDRALGCIFGGAIGDAFGGPYEGQSPPIKITAQTQLRLSDDTQLTLATCEAIVEAEGCVDPETIASRFASWHRQKQITGVGASTHKALTELAAGGHWALTGAKGERAAGNGAAMRIAPLAFVLDPSNSNQRQTIRDVCRITHHHDEAYVGALAVILSLRAALDATWKGGTDLINIIASSLPDSRVRDRLEDLVALGVDAPLMEVAAKFGNSGYVAESVPLAIYGAQLISRLGFAGVIDELIRTGGDTDTIASMAGQICGANLGYDALPAELLEQLPEKNLIDSISSRFAHQLT